MAIITRQSNGAQTTGAAAVKDFLGGHGIVFESWNISASDPASKPEGISDEEAAAIALVGITAHIGLVLKAGLREGEIVFVNGGSGGVGSMVVQIAKASGARVIATAGSDARVTKAAELGADEVINYQTEDVAARVKALAPQGVNVLWETRRETDLDWAVSLLAQRGRLIVMAGREARPVLPVGPLYVKDCSVHGFAMFDQSLGGSISDS